MIPLLLLLAACGEPPITAPDAVEYDGSNPVSGEPNRDGLVVIDSARRGVKIEVDVDDTTDSNFAGTVITYDETGDTGILTGFNTETGAAGMYIVDLAGYPPRSAEALRLEPQLIDPLSVSILLAATFFAWNELRMLNQEINVTIEQIPSVSIEDGIVEMCVTPDEFVYFTLALAASQEKAIENYQTFMSSVLLVFTPGPAMEYRELVGQALDSGHLGGTLLTEPLSSEVRRRAADALDRTEFGIHDTLRVTLIDFREPVGVGDSYYWGTMLVTDAGCDPATFTESLGSVAITSPLEQLDTSGDSVVKVEVSPAERDLNVHLTYEVRDDVFADMRLLRRLPPVRTNSDGVAWFAIPPFNPATADTTSTITATVPERRVTTTEEITWSGAPTNYSPHVWNFRLLGSQAIVNEEAAFTFGDLNQEHAAYCAVNWGEGAGWETFSCANPSAIFVHQLKHTYASTGLFAPRLRVSNSEAGFREAYTVISVAEPPSDEPPSIEVATYQDESFMWRFRHNNPLAFHECYLEDPPFMQFHMKECPREGSVPLDYLWSGATFHVVSTTDGLAASVDVRTDVNTAPDLTEFQADPSTLTEGESTTFTWNVSDLDRDSVTCRIDADGNGTTDHTITACEVYKSQALQYDTAGTYTATLEADDRRGGTAVMSTTVMVEPSTTSTGTTFAVIAAGGLHSLAIDTGGDAWSWGWNLTGQLGDGGTNTSMSAPGQVVMPPSTTFTAITGSQLNHSLALDTNGTAWSWGEDHFGQLGDGGNNVNMETPVQVLMPVATTFAAITGGYGFSVALDTTGNAWSWGDDIYGQLGDTGTITGSRTPIQVAMPAGTTFTTIAAGWAHVLALDQEGNAWSWGRDNFGQLGDDGTDTNKDTPVPVAMPAGVTFAAISAGEYYSLALDEDGNAWSWGRDSSGQLGDGGAYASMDTPVQVAMPTGVTFATIAAGHSQSLALDQIGNAWSWGSNTSSSTPIQLAMPTGVTFTNITGGDGHALALDQDGNAWSWGRDDYGQLGNGGTNTGMATPVPVLMP